MLDLHIVRDHLLVWNVFFGLSYAGFRGSNCFGPFFAKTLFRGFISMPSFSSLSMDIFPSLAVFHGFSMS